jgi:hypothetical protein
LKLWLLDADVIIKLLELDVFDRLADKHELHVAATVVDEVKYYRRDGQTGPFNSNIKFVIKQVFAIFACQKLA